MPYYFVLLSIKFLYSASTFIFRLKIPVVRFPVFNVHQFVFIANASGKGGSDCLRKYLVHLSYLYSAPFSPLDYLFRSALALSERCVESEG